VSLTDNVGLLNVVEDTTPELGGTLDALTNDITNVGDLDADSGAFTSGLTVSGVPVCIDCGGGGGVTDHGALTGLGDDDHPQYGQLADAETAAGIWNFSNGLTVSGVPVCTDCGGGGGGFSGLVETENVHVLDPENRFYLVDYYAQYAYDIKEARFKTGAGSLTASVTIDGVVVEGLDNLSVTTGAGNATATSANSVSAGSRVVIAVSGTVVPEDLEFAVKTERA
jgi:hypothetical protein